MQAAVLAGGLGTRLRSVIGDTPKPMAPVVGRPFLEYILLQLRSWGVDEAVLCVSYRGELVRAYFGNGQGLGLRLRYSHEPERRGTAGALKAAEHLIAGETFLVMNGDSFFDIELDALVAHHQKLRAIATVALAKVEDAQRFGRVETDEAGIIQRFVEKQPGRRPGIINGGIYILTRRVLELIPDARAVSLEQDVFPRLIGERFGGIAFDDYFLDIGVPSTYQDLRANPSRLLAATRSPRGPTA